MPKLTKAEKDVEEAQAAAFRVGQHVIGVSEGPLGTPTEPPVGPVAAPTALDTRNPAAVALSALGASKGGKARAASLSKTRRSEIAKKAAAARWKSD